MFCLHHHCLALTGLTRALVLAVPLLVAGCGTLDVPRADNYPASGQKKARAVHHWDVLADDVAQRIAGKLADWPAGEHPIHVRVAEASDFGLGFRKLLIARLLDQGVTLSKGPADVELEVQTQLVQHAAPVRNSSQMPWTRLAAGVSVVRDWHAHAQSAASGIATGLALGAMIDMSELHTQGSAAGGPTRTEVLVTTTLHSADRYLAASADFYYIEREDAVLYQPPAPVAPPAPVKTWRVVTP